MITKSQLREQMKARRQALPAEEQAALNQRITANILAHPDIASAKIILSYLAFSSEADTRAALLALLEQGKTVIAPPTTAFSDQLNCFHFLSVNDPLLSNNETKAERVPETCDLLRLREVDVFLVPGLAWDSRGYRVGYGGGYFDRLLALASPKAEKIGIGFEFQLVDHIPDNTWDIRVDTITTELRVMLTRP